MATFWALLSSTAILVTLVTTFFAWLRTLRQSKRELTEADLCITVMKPMAGVDPSLEQNLESFAALQAPASFEVLLCLPSETDAGMAVARKFVEKYPHRFRVTAGADPRLGNAKIAQLVHAWPLAKNPFIWVSESNVETSQAFMEALARAWKDVNARQRKPTLVHAPLVGVGGSGLGAALERMHLSSLQNPNQELSRTLGMHAVVGKTEFFHRDDMLAVGGLERFGNYLGEDFMMGAAFNEAGWVRCTGVATRNVLGPLSFKTWFDRHARWAVMRKTLVGFAFYGLEPMNILTWPLLFWALGLIPFSIFAGLFAVRLFIDGANYAMQTREWPRLTDVLLVPVKELAVFLTWALALTTFHVKWRADRAIKLGPQSLVLSKSAKPSKLVRHRESLERLLRRAA